MVETSNTRYVPILKWRAGEKHALENVNQELKKYIVPLIELIVDEGDDTSKLATDIARIWSGPAFLDVHYRPLSSARFALEVISKPESGVDIIPVVRLDTSSIIIEDIKTAVGMNNNGFAIRLDAKNEEKFDRLSHDVDLLIKQICGDRIDKGKIDIIIDFSYLESHKNYGTKLHQISSNLPMDGWRRVIMASGVFPEFLSQFSPNEDNFLQRAELDLWNEHKKIISRETVYADYTTRYPESKTKIPIAGSISVRYTLIDRYQIFRGTKTDPTFKYLVHAFNIQELYSIDYPTNYSWGDSEIGLKATQLRDCLAAGQDPETYEDFHTGRREDWVAISINHHISVTLKQNL